MRLRIKIGTKIYWAVPAGKGYVKTTGPDTDALY